MSVGEVEEGTTPNETVPVEAPDEEVQFQFKRVKGLMLSTLSVAQTLLSTVTYSETFSSQQLDEGEWETSLVFY